MFNWSSHGHVTVYMVEQTSLIVFICYQQLHFIGFRCSGRWFKYGFNNMCEYFKPVTCKCEIEAQVASRYSKNAPLENVQGVATLAQSLDFLSA